VTFLLVLGAIGLAGLAFGFVAGDLDVDLGPDWLSLPVLAALVGAFGFVGAAAVSLGAPLALAVPVAAVAGVAVAAATYRLARGLMHMPTDASLRGSDLVGRPGRIVTALTPDRSGEVLVSQAGQQLKLSARGDETLVVGTAIVVVESLSPTLVRVESHDRFWAARPDAIPPPDQGPLP
jgi:membrane protein implicated in regulation of membrane protease activity